MTFDLLRRALVTRRAFVSGAATGSLTALPTWRTADDTDDLAAAERLLDLEFRDDERELAAPRVAGHREDLARLRAEEVLRDTAPALRFDPRPPGSATPTGQRAALPEPGAAPATPASDEDLAFASVHDLAALLRSGAVTSRQLTELALQRLENHDPKLLCVVNLTREHALAAADRADREIARGEWRGPLHGIPYGAKDLLAHPGTPTTFGAAPFRDQVLDEEATVLARLREAGAVLVAKLSLGALAMGDVWFGGKTRNPWNTEQGSSGSSAGSAAAVAAGLVPFAIGSETYGSIVSPCSRCGVTGLRPTFGRVSRHGAMPLSWTMDKLGPIARTAADCALVLHAIHGRDGLDHDAVDAPFDWSRGRDISGLRIGILEDEAWERPQERTFLDALRATGAEISELQLPDAPYRSLLIILFCEAATAFDDLTRSGGLRELTSQGPRDWPNTMRSARFIPAVEYLRAMRIRSKLIADTAVALDGVDVLVSPSFGNRALACTNLTGHPCCVVPLGAREDGSPTTITIHGKLWGEAEALAVAEHWQTHTDWHLRRPPLD